MQHLGVNFGGIWRFELFFFIWVFLIFAPKSGLILKVQWQHSWSRACNAHSPTLSARYTPRAMNVVQCLYLSV